MGTEDIQYLVELEGIGKDFGGVTALAGVSLRIRPGESVGVVGHNGAGKSTLMGVLRGTLRPTSGTVRIRGEDVTGNHSVRRAYELGIRSVFQEPSLCLTLKVFENVRLLDPNLSGFGWAARARRLISEKLDEIFPGHGISANATTGDLSPASRQMVEIARAFVVVAAPVRLVILDEPTSSLDASVTGRFMQFLKLTETRGQSYILISHRLKEIVGTTSRVVVMRDGFVVSEESTVGLHEERLVERMGVMAQERERNAAPDAVPITTVVRSAGESGDVRVQVTPAKPGPITLTARAGEVVGLAGLAAHGQRATLLRTFEASRTPQHGATVNGTVAYVSGDRFGEGIFPLWSVGLNLTVGALKSIIRHGLIGLDRENRLAETWRERIAIKTPSVRNSIGSLSGGNQQKVLIARALCSGADIILLDDPMRGVDVNAKREMFEHIRAEAAKGQCFLLYTTESEELSYCDRIYVFYSDGITDEIPRAELTEERVLKSSFASTGDGPSPAPRTGTEGP
jgi:ribose transport system ATP-binding protein